MGRKADAREDPSPQAQRAYWDERWEGQRSPNDWQMQRAETILALLKDLSLDRPRILDLGCATGWMTKLLSEFGPAAGVDLSETAIEMARSRYPEIQFSAGDLYEISLTDQPVDVVVCQEVIAHVSDQPLLVRRIAEVIKPGGYLIISAANKLVMDRLKDSDGLVGVGAEDPDDHIKKWLDMRGLKRLIEPYFTVTRTTSVIPMGPRGWLRVIHSQKLNTLATWLISRRRWDALKERVGFGYTIIAVGQKNP